MKGVLGRNAIARGREDCLRSLQTYPPTRLTFLPGLGVIGVDLGLRPLLAAFGEGWNEVVELLLAAGRQTLRNAADRCVEKAITEGGEEICTGKNMLHIAAGKGHTEMVEVLLDHDHDIEGFDVDCVDTENNTALYYACANGKVDVAHILVAAGANVQTCGKGGPLLHLASALGQLELVEFLVKWGCDVHRIWNYKEGGTATDVVGDKDNEHLWQLSTEGKSQCLAIMERLLKDCRASNSPDGDCYQSCLNRALFKATKLGIPDTVAWLLYEGADCNYNQFIEQYQIGSTLNNTDTNLPTPLEQAVWASISNRSSRRDQVIKLLLTAGATVDVRYFCRNPHCMEQMTPLYHACHRREKGLVEVLLATSADRNILDSKGHTLAQKIEEAMSTIWRLRLGGGIPTHDDLWVNPIDIRPDDPQSDALVVYEEILALFRYIPPSLSP